MSEANESVEVAARQRSEQDRLPVVVRAEGLHLVCYRNSDERVQASLVSDSDAHTATVARRFDYLPIQLQRPQTATP